VILVEWKCKYK